MISDLPSGVEVIPDTDVSYLDRLLIPGGRLAILPAATYLTIHSLDLRLWCQRRGYYCLPTVELVAWLKDFIGNAKAIEVAAGNGELGDALRIPITDSHTQLKPGMRAYYKSIGCAVTHPPPHCRKLDAVAAVKRHRPDICIAAWLTQQGNSEAETPDSFSYGADELEILKHVPTYCLIGNEAIHGRKKIMGMPHITLKPAWLISRAKDQSKNAIWVFNWRICQLKGEVHVKI